MDFGFLTNLTRASSPTFDRQLCGKWKRTLRTEYGRISACQTCNFSVRVCNWLWLWIWHREPGSTFSQVFVEVSQRAEVAVVVAVVVE